MSKKYLKSYLLNVIKDCVAILDSGIGGISILKEAIKANISKNYFYFADTINMPYGTKDKKELYKITCQNIKKIISICSPRLIIIACNTIGSTVFKKIKRKYKKIKIVAIHPNVKKILNHIKHLEKTTNKSKKMRAVIIATPQTINAIKKSFAYQISKNNIILCKLPHFATKIENNLGNMHNIVPYINRIFKKFNSFDYIYLGCTHYILAKDFISKVCNNAIVEDGSDNLISYVKSVLKHNINQQSKIFSIKLFLTKDDGEIRNRYNFAIEELTKNIF